MELSYDVTISLINKRAAIQAIIDNTPPPASVGSSYHTLQTFNPLSQYVFKHALILHPSSFEFKGKTVKDILLRKLISSGINGVNPHIERYLADETNSEIVRVSIKLFKNTTSHLHCSLYSNFADAMKDHTTKTTFFDTLKEGHLTNYNCLKCLDLGDLSRFGDHVAGQWDVLHQFFLFLGERAMCSMVTFISMDAHIIGCTYEHTMILICVFIPLLLNFGSFSVFCAPVETVLYGFKKTLLSAFNARIES